MLHHQSKPISSSNNFSNYLSHSDCYSALILGTWALGGSHFGAYDTDNALSVIRRCYDEGVRQFDSAEFYAKGQSQDILKKALAGMDPNSYVLHLKAGLRWDGNRVLHDGTEAHINQVVTDALRFFKRDKMDVFLLHWPDPNTDIRIACDTLSRLRVTEKIAFWGLCNLEKKHLNHIQGYDYSVCHFHYNPLYTATSDLMRNLHKDQTYIAAYSPFEQGLLVNPEFLSENILAKRDIRRRNPFFSDSQVATALKTLFTCHCDSFSYSQIIIQWIIDTDFVDGVVFGSRFKDQLDLILDVLKFSKIQKNHLRQTAFYQRLSSLLKT
jgi:aryl-alcohol dehydrogenase-like predicted oxidoreductase